MGMSGHSTDASGRRPAFGAQNVHAQSPILSSAHSAGTGVNNRESARDINTGIGAGVGVHTSERSVNRIDLMHAYGPAPMAMPVSVTIPVPSTSVGTVRTSTSTNSPHSHVSLRDYVPDRRPICSHDVSSVSLYSLGNSFIRLCQLRRSPPIATHRLLFDI